MDIVDMNFHPQKNIPISYNWDILVRLYHLADEYIEFSVENLEPDDDDDE